MYGISSIFSPSLFSYNTTAASAYNKLMKSRYESSNPVSSYLNKSSSQTYNNVTKSTDALADDINKLSATGKNSVFSTHQDVDSTGKKINAYNPSGIYKAVKSFVNDYNNVIDSSLMSGNQQIQRSAQTMTGTSRIMSKSLSDVGIRLGSDGKLSIDEGTFLNSDMSKVKNLFNGAGSYAKTIGTESQRVAQTANYESNRAQKYNNLAGYGLYNSLGSFGNNSYGSSFSNYLNYYSMFNGFF